MRYIDSMMLRSGPEKLCAGLGLLAAASVACAQPAVFNGFAVAPFFHAAQDGRVDVVCIGDSNQLHFGGGWDRAWTRALQTRLGLYASGIITPGEGAGNGGGVGEGWGVLAVGQGIFQTSAAPPSVDRYLNAIASGLGPHSYIYLAPGLVAPGTVAQGMVLYIIAPFAVAEPLRFHYAYAEFDGTGAGSFRPIVRSDDAPPFPELATGDVISTRSGAGGGTRARRAWLDLPAGERPMQMSMHFARSSESIVGPFAAFGMRVEQLTATRGASLHTLYGVGGQSARDMAAALIASDDATLTLYFEQVRGLGSRAVLIRVNTGLNDRIESLPSVGPAAVSEGSSAAAYADNLRAIVARIREVWALNGWDERELYFLFTPSHAVAMPDEALLVGYREAARVVADEIARTAVVDFEVMANATQMQQNLWYYASFDRNHLRASGFDALSALELNGLIAAAACSADVDSSGGIDGDDIIRFFGRWDANLMDYNNDGGTDSDDVISFFLDWDRGCGG